MSCHYYGISLYRDSAQWTFVRETLLYPPICGHNLPLIFQHFASIVRHQFAIKNSPSDGQWKEFSRPLPMLFDCQINVSTFYLICCWIYFLCVFLVKVLRSGEILSIGSIIAWSIKSIYLVKEFRTEHYLNMNHMIREFLIFAGEYTLKLFRSLQR